MDENRVRGMLGICQRAGGMQSGTDMVLKCIRDGRCRLALLDEGSSGATQKKIADACGCRGVSLMYLPAGLLGEACGREGRMTAAVLEEGFADRIRGLCGDGFREIIQE